MKPTRYIPYRPTQITPPGATLSDLIEERRLVPAALAQALALDEAAFDALLAGDLPLTPALAHRLEAAVGVPADYWLRHEDGYRTAQPSRKLRASGKVEEETDV